MTETDIAGTIRFGIRKVFGIVAAYAILISVMRSRGTPGVISAVIAGTTFSILLLIARRDDMPAIVNVTIGALVGAFIGMSCLSNAILGQVYLYDHGFGEGAKSNMAGVFFGTLLGGFVGSLCEKHAPKRRITNEPLPPVIANESNSDADDTRSTS